MPGFNPDKLNIHDLTVEEPEQQTEAPFDPEKDVTPDQWEGFKDYFEKYRQANKDNQIFRFMVRDLTILNHKPELSQKEKEILENGKNFEFNAAENLAILAIMGEKINVPDSTVKSLLDNIQRPKSSLEERSDSVRLLAILGKKDLIPKDTGDKLIEGLNKVRVALNTKVGTFRTVVALKILGRPESSLASEGWQYMKELINVKIGKNNAPQILKIMADMAIVAADEVRIPEGGGLELISHKKEKLSSETPKMPEQRNF